MEEKNNIPKIRFKGFTDEWEKCRLGEILQALPFKKFIKVPEQDGRYEIIQQGNNPIIGYANGIPCNAYQEIVIFGDHTLSLYKPNNPFFVATDGVRIIKGKQFIDGHYLLSLLEKYKPRSEGYKRYYSILVEYQCCISKNRKEQDKIGRYFKELDQLITLQESKYDKLLNIKKVMLEKMFPQNEKNLPEWRFREFHDAWLKYKLLELTNYKNGKGHEDRQSNSGKYELINLNSISINGGLKSSGRFINFAEETLIKNDLVMVLSDVGHGDLLGRVAIIPESNKFVLNQRVALLRIKTNIVPRFLFTYINVYQKYFKQNGAGSSQLNISKECVEQFFVMTPNNYEQQKISTFFQHLDTLITLQQNKIEKLNHIKKALLENMFV